MSDAQVIRCATLAAAEELGVKDRGVLEEGKIVGKGTHEELLRTCKVYQEFAKSQGMEGKKHEHQAS